MKQETGISRLPELDWLLGEWRRFGQFTDRASHIYKRFSYELTGMILVGRTQGFFPPSEVTIDFEIHQDNVLYFRNGGGLEAIGFYREGYVNLFRVSVTEKPSQLTAESYGVKHAPEGTRAKVIYERDGGSALHGEFLVARPGESLETIEKSVMERTA